MAAGRVEWLVGAGWGRAAGRGQEPGVRRGRPRRAPRGRGPGRVRAGASDRRRYRRWLRGWRVRRGSRVPRRGGGGGGVGGGWGGVWRGVGVRSRDFDAAARAELPGVVGRGGFGQVRPTAAGTGGGCEGGEFDEVRASRAGVAEVGVGEQRQPYRSG